MKEQLVTYDTAILAKKKGFDIPVQYGVYGPKMKLTYDLGFRNNPNLKLVNWNAETKQQRNSRATSIPSQNLLQKWLREKHNCFIEVALHGEEDKNWDINPKNLLFGFTVDYYGKNFEIPMGEEEDINQYNFKSYEEALEIGLQGALKLIKDGNLKKNET